MEKETIPISYAERLFVACRIATGAMAREIPEKPMDGKCGRCVRASGKPTKLIKPGLEKNWNYCPICGQAINWGADEMRIPGEWEDR